MSYPTRHGETWPQYAVVCGNVRSEQDALSVFEVLLKWRADGVIDEIVWSTWFGELAKSDAVRTCVLKNRIHLVESPEPQLVVMGHVMHQQKSLRLGLYACPKPCWVFKCRTDKVVPETYHRAFLERTEKLPDIRDLMMPGTFKRRVVVHSGTVTTLFEFNDTFFWGERDDLLKFCDFNIDHEFVFDPEFLTAELRLWSTPFIRHVLPVSKYLSRFNPMVKERFPYEVGHEIFKTELSSNHYMAMLMSFYNLVDQYFHIGFGECPVEILNYLESPNTGFTDLFDKDYSQGHGLGFYQDQFKIYCTTQAWLTAFSNGKLNHKEIDAQYHSIFTAIGQVPFGRMPETFLSHNPFDPDPSADELEHTLRTRFGIVTPRPIYIPPEASE